ncbi:hypothetical protein DLM86_12860 [Paenibacillus flagellatus]|uniref:Uncharacterized protein n=1 Tax=Paenibacillus flagellatus TaxID=2211139 RepID=A0A2V5K4V9_9BACL|nr:hypothetical protein DLM86_12860 [Paenibacillus flagellatus]
MRDMPPLFVRVRARSEGGGFFSAVSARFGRNGAAKRPLSPPDTSVLTKSLGIPVVLHYNKV